MATFAKATFSHTSYAAFRPSYSNDLFDILLAYHQGPKNLLLDLGCGTGIASYPLSRRFERVIGTDPSAGMVREAQAGLSRLKPRDKKTLKLSFQQSSAEHSPFLDRGGEVDCVTAAQSAHWFDQPRLWPELQRIVRKSGTLAFWGYKDHVFPYYPSASEILQHYAYDPHPDCLGSYWPQPGRSYLQDKLRIIQPPAEAWEDVQRIEYEPGLQGANSGKGKLLMKRTVTVGACKEYVRTWSAYHGWKERHQGMEPRAKGGEGDVVDGIFDEIARKEKHFEKEENKVYIEWGSAMILARRK